MLEALLDKQTGVWYEFIPRSYFLLGFLTQHRLERPIKHSESRLSGGGRVWS